MRSKPTPVSMFALGQVGERSVRAAEVLHEHEVPELRGSARRRRVGRSSVRPELGAAVAEQLASTDRRDPCRPSPRSCPCRPGADPLRRERRRRRAQISLGLVVAGVDRDPDAVAVEAEHLGDELPRPRDRFGLEVVTEAPVAEHLEEAEMTSRAADVVEVVVLASGPHAFLDRRGPRWAERRLLFAEEVRDELHHPRVGEHRRGRMVRDQAGRRHERVVLVLPEAAQVRRRSAARMVESGYRPAGTRRMDLHGALRSPHATGRPGPSIVGRRPREISVRASAWLAAPLPARASAARPSARRRGRCAPSCVRRRRPVEPPRPACSARPPV